MTSKGTCARKGEAKEKKAGRMAGMGSSIRNAVKRKTHKERAQPSNRQRFGLLEKKKDYVLRARDHNLKKKRLAALQEKAAFRNPDEFYFKMQSMGTNEGVHTRTGGASLDMETALLLKTQDQNYISMKKRVDENKIQKLEASLHAISAAEAAPQVNKHTIFFDSDDDMGDFEASKHFDTHPGLVGRAVNRPRMEQLEAEEEPVKPMNKMARKKVRFTLHLHLPLLPHIPIRSGAGLISFLGASHRHECTQAKQCFMPGPCLGERTNMRVSFFV